MAVVMRESKKQIWLTAEQLDLTVECLRFTQARLYHERAMADPAHKMAGLFTGRRIDDLIEIFAGKKPAQ